MQNALISGFISIVLFGCAKQNSGSESDVAVSPTYQAHALLSFQGGEGPDTLFQNQVKNLRTNEFQSRVEERFRELWDEQDNQRSDLNPPIIGDYDFVPQNRFVTVTSTASDPKVAMNTANAVAYSTQMLYMEIAREKSDESVAWLNREAEKQMEKIRRIDLEIQQARRNRDNQEKLKELLYRREKQVEVVNSIREKIEDERIIYDQRAVSVHILEQAENAFRK